MSNIKGRLEKMESIAHAGRRPVYVILRPDESEEQALARRHVQYPDTPLPSDADIHFITWLA
jgi:hypothetical protein